MKAFPTHELYSYSARDALAELASCYATICILYYTFRSTCLYTWPDSSLKVWLQICGCSGDEQHAHNETNDDQVGCSQPKKFLTNSSLFSSFIS